MFNFFFRKKHKKKKTKRSENANNSNNMECNKVFGLKNSTSIELMSPINDSMIDGKIYFYFFSLKNQISFQTLRIKYFWTT
jgi:hypothetical protein